MGAAIETSHRASGRRRPRRKPMSEINVTPFVDVMLVLLIVFMVAAPLLASGVPVDLPQTAAAPLALDKQPVTVTVETDGKVFVQDQEVASADLVARLKSVTSSSDDRIYVRGDKAASYGTVMQVMGTISGAGFSHLALVALNDSDG
jgi:biopolymer transport protein TolR